MGKKNANVNQGKRGDKEPCFLIPGGENSFGAYKVGGGPAKGVGKGLEE